MKAQSLIIAALLLAVVLILITSTVYTDSAKEAGQKPQEKGIYLRNYLAVTPIFNIKFAIPEVCSVTIRIYDSGGRLADLLVTVTLGPVTISWSSTAAPGLQA
jgi:hypothetical protein